MNEVRHRTLTPARWHELRVTEQLGNIGSEVSRAARWRARNPELAQSAFYRALELIDLRWTIRATVGRARGCAS